MEGKKIINFFLFFKDIYHSQNIPSLYCYIYLLFASSLWGCVFNFNPTMMVYFVFFLKCVLCRYWKKTYYFSLQCKKMCFRRWNRMRRKLISFLCNNRCKVFLSVAILYHFIFFILYQEVDSKFIDAAQVFY